MREHFAQMGLLGGLTVFFAVGLVSVVAAAAPLGWAALPALGFHRVGWRPIVFGAIATLIVSVAVSQLGIEPEGVKQAIKVSRDPAQFLASLAVMALLAPVVEEMLPTGWTSKFGPAVLHVVTLAIAFFFVLLVWSLASRLVKTLIHATPLSVVDRLGGAGFGALRGLFIALLLVLVVGASPLAESATWQASRAAPVLGGVLHDVAPLLPEPLARFVSRSMTPSESDSTD